MALIIGLIGVLCGIAAWLAIAATIFVGAWDTAVWLFKADWQTTNFAVPKVAGIAAVILWFTNQLFIGAMEMLFNWANRLDPDLKLKEE